MAGLIGRKIGMTQIFAEDGTVIPVTVIEAGPNVVTQIKTPQTDGYSAVQLGYEESKRLNKPERGHLKKLPPLRHLRELGVGSEEHYELGQRLDVGLFRAGELLDVTGISKGKGFAGVVKRHHFSGGPKTHGQSDRHRAPGSIGSGTTPGRVLKGLRMAGRMGHDRVTVRNLEIVRLEPEQNLLLVKGAVPGPTEGLLLVRQAKSARKPKKA
jgi:large subunit ribosomal protein L3